MTKPSIGFIGLGLMGSAMVERLQSCGYALTITANRSRAPIDAAVSRGATEVPTARDVAAASDIVMLCMDTSQSVESRMRGPDGVVSGLRPGGVIVDFGTSLPASTRELGQEVQRVGGVYMDAPLGRTPLHAKDGLLNIMCSGDRDTFDRIRPVLEDIGENIFHLGDLGAGHTIKLINNFFAMTTANAMSEAFAMADVMGIERKAVYDVLAAGPNRSGMMDFVKAYALEGDPNQLAFAVKNGAKDVGYYVQMAKEVGVESIMAACALKGLTLARDEGHAEKMVPQMVDFYSARYRD